jgi:hypothetical protein
LLSGCRYSPTVLKLVLAAAVIVGIIIGAAKFSAAHHASGPAPGGPVVVREQVPNPLGGGQSSGGDQVVVP